MEVFGLPLTELVGYLASFLVLVSFLMKEVRRLRIVNTIGCFVFIIYGVMLQISWPIVITNVAIFGINIYYLFRNNKK
ncbi:MAG: Na+-driven multidrug efflux pump [Flavobacteriaceae bacterium]